MKAVVYYNPGFGYGHWSDSPNRTINFEGATEEDLQQQILQWYRKASNCAIDGQDFIEALTVMNDDAFNEGESLAVIYKVEIDGRVVYEGIEPIVEKSKASGEYVMTALKHPDGTIDKIPYQDLYGYDPMTEVPQDPAADELYNLINKKLS